MFARPSILLEIVISRIEQSKKFSLFVETVKQSLCVRKHLLKIFLAKLKFSRNLHSKKFLNFPIVSQWKFGGNGQFSLGN